MPHPDEFAVRRVFDERAIYPRLPGSRELFEQLLTTLSAADRLVITLLMLEEKSVAEISQQTGWSRTLVKVRAFRARRRLRRALAELEKGKP